MELFEYRPFLVFGTVMAAILGAVMGSFLNCAAWRIVREEPFLRGHSHCASCGHPLGWKELIPVLSWVFLGGKCRWCGERISARYPLTELLFAAVSAACFLRFGVSVLCLRNYVFLCCLFCLTLTDLDDMIIPDGCHIISAAAWLLALPFTFTGWADTLLHILAAVVFGGVLLGISVIMDRRLGRESLGGGDIKLFAVTGLYLGFAGTLFTVLLSCILGLAVYAAVLRKNKSGQAFPFGPSIAAAAAVMLLFGDWLISWYTNLL